MHKKFLRWTIVLVFLFGIGFILFDCLLWRLFRFNYCCSPTSLYISNLDVNDNVCYVSVENMASGSFSTTKYNGLVFVFSGGVLKLGVHKGTFGAKEQICKEIVVNSQITEVRLCGKGGEHVIFKK